MCIALNTRVITYDTIRVGTTEINIEIIIWSDEPDATPHFHVFNRNKDRENECCIKIESAEYINLNSINTKLDARQRKGLIDFLKQPFGRKAFIGINWEFLLFLWNVNNSQSEVPDDIPMPNYENIKWSERMCLL